MKNFLKLLIVLSIACSFLHAIPHYYCVPCDEEFFPQLLNLIGSIHKNDSNHLGEIAVYDLGMTNFQKKFIQKLEKVTLNSLELTHPDLLKPFATDNLGRKVRGHFAWKPVILKMGLDKFPYFLYIDSGLLILKDLDDLFQYIKNEGYFFVGLDNYNVEERLTAPVIYELNKGIFRDVADTILDPKTRMHQASIQGISKMIEYTYVKDFFDLSSRLSLFIDDGTSRLGYGEGRHDQTISSILISRYKYKMFRQGPINLYINDSPRQFVCSSEALFGMNHVLLGRSSNEGNEGFRKYIKKMRKTNKQRAIN